MVQQNGRISFVSPPDTRTIQNQPTSTAESEEAGEADEPPDPQIHGSASTDSMASTKSEFQKSVYSTRKPTSLLSRILHTSESDSHVDEDDYAFYEPNRTTSSASTYSRSSAVSVNELTSDAGHTSAHTSNPGSPTSAKITGIPPVFKQNSFFTPATIRAAPTESIAPIQAAPVEDVERKVEAGLGRKRCIMFACGAKSTTEDKSASEKMVAEVQKAVPPPAQRKCSLKFVCPLPAKVQTNDSKKGSVRLSSPPPPARRIQAVKVHRGSDSTVRTVSPKTVRKIASATLRPRRDSQASDMSRSEATRFHEFASSEEEIDDWTKEVSCFQRRLTIDDTLAMENKLRKIGREVEEEEAEEDEEDAEAAAVEDDDDEEEEEDEEEDEEDEDVDQSVHSGYISDEGFQTDDEHGFAHSDDSDGGSDYDWWAPGRSAARGTIEHIRPPRPRRGSDSTIESVQEDGAIPISPHVRRKACRKSNRPTNPLELPDSTDFVCGTLDEDKPLEQAYMNHLEKRRAAKHRAVPQDIDPTFPASDPEIDEEEDEVSDHAPTESDHPIFAHGSMDLGPSHLVDAEPRSSIPRKRSPIPSPRRLRSPPPAKRINLHRSPPPVRRARSPAPQQIYGRQRLSSSVPRRRSQVAIRQELEDQANGDDDSENTPRFSRRAVDIVMGLEKKRQRRHEKNFERYHRKTGKATKSKDKKHIAPGKGAERMRDLGIGLNEYRGRKTSLNPQHPEEEVHMLSY
ncbi:hypothetical protein BT63DRAFT_43271 [Microthyrium microscopicum]|uniref:Extensin domain-containing protein n=1 Tax=Microthyrium microscopicum TaxID=703497 RepID=A0A6A6U1U0_9PEZI|nr:hypothetical protein BT63DRAFT_43271 [Microthyrium microscopicum]